MPKHVSIPPGRKKHAKTCHNKHAKSCQDTTCQKYIKTQASNMAVDLLNESQKPSLQQQHMLKSQMHCMCVTRSILCTKHAKSCQDTPCQTYQLDKHKASNMSVDLQRVRTISYSNRSLRRQAVESKCRVRCQEVFKDSYTGQFCKRSSVAAPLASNLSVNSRR